MINLDINPQGCCVFGRPGVAKLANGMTIRCVPRLAAIPNTEQRMFKLVIN